MPKSNLVLYGGIPHPLGIGTILASAIPSRVLFVPIGILDAIDIYGGWRDQLQLVLNSIPKWKPSIDPYFEYPRATKQSLTADFRMAPVEMLC